MDYVAPPYSGSVQPSFTAGPGTIWADPAQAGLGVNVRPYLLSRVADLKALNGGRLMLPPAIWDIGPGVSASEGGLLFDAPNINIEVCGFGQGQTILRAADDLNVPMTGIIRTKSGTAQRNLKIRDLTLDGNRANQSLDTVAFYCGVSPNNPANVTVSAGIATLTYASAHERTVGQRMYVESWFQPLLRGDYIVLSVPTATTLTIAVATGVVNENNVPTYKTTFEVGVGTPVLANVAVAGGVATFTFATAHGRTIGEQIWVNSPTQQAFRGWYFVATIPNTTTLTVAVGAGIVSENNVQTHDEIAPNLYDENIIIENVEAKNCKKSGPSGGYAFDPHEITRGFWIGGGSKAHDNDGPALALDGIREFFAEVQCYRNHGAAVESYTYSRDGRIVVNGYENGYNLGGSPIASIGFEGASHNIEVEGTVRDGKGVGLVIGFGSSAIRAKVTVVDHGHHAAQVRGGTYCDLDITAIDCGQAADGVYSAIDLDGGQAGYPNANNTVRALKVVRTKANRLLHGVNNRSNTTGNKIGPLIDVPFGAITGRAIENAGAQSTVATVGTAAGRHPGLRAGRWYPTVRVGDNGNLTLVNRRIYYALIELPAGARINRWAFRQLAGGNAAATTRFGVYGNTRGAPAGLVVDLTAFSASTAVGDKIHNPADIGPEGGLYWVAMGATSGGTLPNVTAYTPSVSMQAAWLFGLAAIADLTDAALTPVGYYYDENPLADPPEQYIANGFPAVAPITGPIVNGGVPVVFLEGG